MWDAGKKMSDYGNNLTNVAGANGLAMSTCGLSGPSWHDYITRI